MAEREARKDAYVSGQILPSLNGIKHCIWSLKTAPKIKIFLGKVISGAIPVADHLIERGMKVDTRCQTCGMEGESMNHVLFTFTIARRSWVLCNYPVPENGFDPSFIYSNIFYVLKMGNNQRCPSNIRRSGSWILWSIWKNRHSLLFNGSLSVGQIFAKSIFEEVDHWFLVKEMENHDRAFDLERKKRIIFGWKPPHVSWLKCDIGSSWNKSNFEGGASFSNIRSKLESTFESWKWTIESMKSLRMNSVIFSSEDHNLVGTITKPTSWPSLKFYSIKLSSMLHELLSWRVKSQSRKVRRPAFLLADSVVKKNFFQSYISTGFLA